MNYRLKLRDICLVGDLGFLGAEFYFMKDQIEEIDLG